MFNLVKDDYDENMDDILKSIEDMLNEDEENEDEEEKLK